MKYKRDRVISVRVDDITYTKVWNYAVQHGWSLSHAVAHILIKFFKEC